MDDLVGNYTQLEHPIVLYGRDLRFSTLCRFPSKGAGMPCNLEEGGEPQTGKSPNLQIFSRLQRQ